MNKFAIVLCIAACFEGALSSHRHKQKPERPTYEVNANVPLLTKGQSLVIAGEDAKYIYNDITLYEDASEFGQGDLRIELDKKKALYVNNRLVLKQDPQAPVITKNPILKARNVDSFEIQVDDQGQVTYVVKTSA